MSGSEHPFEKEISVGVENIEVQLHGHEMLPWADFLLNPRRLRGSDFLMRWAQGRWSEERIEYAMNASDRYFALPYGPSGVAPKGVREFELYFERLEAAGLGKLKRPDLLIYRTEDRPEIDELTERLGGVEELSFTREDESNMAQLIKKAVIAVECENSLWVAREMPHYNKPLRPQKRLGGLEGLAKNAVLPTVIVKDEDLPGLRDWQSQHNLNIHIWHAFYDLAFGISLNRVNELLAEGRIVGREQKFQAPSGATSQKTTFNIYHHYAYELGETQGDIKLVADFVKDANGHILPYVRFQGGELKLSPSTYEVLNAEAAQRP